MAERKTLILNVNDDMASLYTTTRTLKQAGFDVAEALSGQQALQKAFDLMPDLVILDVKLPDIDGFEVARRLKADRKTAVIPLVHLSATYRDTKAHVTGLESGAEGYLTMPVEPPVLIATIRTLLRSRVAEAQVVQAGKEWTATFDAISNGICLVDADGIIERTNAGMAKMLRVPSDEIIGRKIGRASCRERV